MVNDDGIRSSMFSTTRSDSMCQCCKLQQHVVQLIRLISIEQHQWAQDILEHAFKWHQQLICMLMI